jgi:hypothetical protein
MEDKQNGTWMCSDHEDFPIAMHNQDLLKANLMDHWLEEMWCVVHREVNKHPQNILASLKAKISEVMTNIDREIVIHPCQRFWSQIEAVVEATGVFIK